LIKECCGTCTELVYRGGHKNSEELKSKVDNIVNSSDIGALYFPIYGSMTTIKFQSRSFFPVVESPGIIFLQGTKVDANAANAVMGAVLQGWPVLVLTLIMAALSGIVMWALDSYWNPEEFPSSFFKGSWEGFWWAFVSMTTVGYGDRAPKSFLARVFAFFWVLVGLVIISIFTATVTTSLTALSLSNDITLYGNNIIAMNNTEEQRYGVKNNAKVFVVNTIEDLKKAIKRDEDLVIENLNAEDAVAGGLIDSYVAGHHNTTLSELEGVKVGTIFDHQFAYGFVTGSALETPLITNCLRRALSTMESKITDIIKNKMTALPEPAQSAAEEKSSNLFDPSSAIFQRAVFTCLGLIALLTVAGIVWEYCYWRPKQKKEAPEKKEISRVITPHTSFEELVAAQCQELEDAMITEVMAFYKAFNHKLDEIRKRHLRDDSLDQKIPPPQVINLDEKKQPIK